jgi:segregation and condensation protein A
MKDDVVDHLLLQREDVAKKESLQKYIEMADGRATMYVDNPFDKAIAATFELVIDEQFDPWEIDLISFSRLYLRKVREAQSIDLMTAGRIILMAWKVLKLQSDYMVQRLEETGQEEEPEEWDDIPDWYMEDDGYTYTRAVIENEAPIEEKVRRDGKRKVTLVELINAFEEARDEVVERQQRQEKRAEQRQRQAEQDEHDVGDNAHQEDIEMEISIVLSRLSQLNGRAIAIGELCDTSDKQDLVMTMSSLLFLARENRIQLWQENFPYGTIYIKNAHYEQT